MNGKGASSNIVRRSERKAGNVTLPHHANPRFKVVDKAKRHVPSTTIGITIPISAGDLAHPYPIIWPSSDSINQDIAPAIPSRSQTSTSIFICPLASKQKKANPPHLYTSFRVPCGTGQQYPSPLRKTNRNPASKKWRIVKKKKKKKAAI